MNATRSLSVLAALSLTGTACAQTETAPNGPSTSVTSPALNPELDGASTTQTQNEMRPRVAIAATQAVGNGMQVRSESGELLGKVASIVPGDADANKAYVVVADVKGFAVPLPYTAASAMVQNHTLVVDRLRFDNAPRVQQHETEDTTRAAWEKQADSYWSGSGDVPSGDWKK